MRTLVIASEQWMQYAGRFQAGLGDGWRVSAGTDDPEWLRREIAGADALIAQSIAPAALPAAAGLKVFQFPGAGIPQLRPDAYPAGCKVVNVFEHGPAIAEFVMGVIVTHVTELERYRESFRSGSWEGSGRMGGAPHGEVSGKTLGLIGYGTIGHAVAPLARAFGMRVIHVTSREGDLGEVLRESDFVLIACPLTERTRGMIGAEQLALLKPSAYLINVARAEVVEEGPLYEALRHGRIAGAALDVWYRYPASGKDLAHGSEYAFHELPNVLATPHMSAWTWGLVERRIARIVENLGRLERGEPLERVVFEGTWTA